MEINTSKPLLEVRDMTVWRGENLLLDEVCFSVSHGSVLQIQGTNGTGKTTLLRAIIGLAEYDEGDVLWKGKSFWRARGDMHGDLLYLGHKTGISPGLTPLENLLALCPELPLSSRDDVETVLSELSIEDRIDLPSAALSAGQQRRVSLARLRLQQARLWVLDEPLTSLDADGYQWVRQEIMRHANGGGTVIFTTHQPLNFDDIQVDSVVLGRAL